mgnify:CR=1 FL=1
MTLPNATTNVSGLMGTADVHAWHDDNRDTWRLITSGGSIRGSPPVILSYESHDGVASGWRFMGVLYTGSRTNRLECPSYYTGSLASSGGDSLTSVPALLTYSWPTAGYSQFWASGTESSGSFLPIQHGQLEYGVGYAGEMTATWPKRLLLFSWMRGVSDGVVYVGAQSLPREIRLLQDGAVAIHVATELHSLIVANSTKSVSLSVQPGDARPGNPPTLPHSVPQQARLQIHISAAGGVLPATFGITLQNDGSERVAQTETAENLEQLHLAVAVKKGSACIFLGSPRQGCAPIGAPTTSSTNSNDASWTLDTDAEMWLDNGLVEVIVGSNTTTTSQAVLSAFYPKLFSATTGLGGSVWSQSNATANFDLKWSKGASAKFAVNE